MKKDYLNDVFLTILFFLFGNVIQAQNIAVKDICELTTDVTARSSAHVDSSGHDCALIRVNIPTVNGLRFRGIVGDVKHHAGEFTMYVSEGTKTIPYSVNGYEEGMIDFEKYGINVSGKSVYRVLLKIEKGNTSRQINVGKLRISTQPESATILLDGVPVGESPLTLDNVSEGNHTIAFPNTCGFSLQDQIVTVKRNETLELHYVLKEETLGEWMDDVELDGSDNDGMGWWPVKYRNIEVNTKHGILDYWGKTVVPCDFDYVSKNSEGDFFMVGERRENKVFYGLFKPQVGLILSCEYDNIMWSSREPSIKVCRNRKWGMVNKNGEEILPCEYMYISEFKNGVYVIGREEKIENKSVNKYGLADVQGRIIVDLKYDFITFFSEGYAGARDFENNAYLIDSIGNVKKLPEGYVPEWTHYCWDGGLYTEGLLCLHKEGKIGVLNQSGKEIVPFVYSEMVMAKNGWVKLKKWNQDKHEYEYVVVDKNEHVYICNEENNHSPIDNYLIIRKEGKEGLIDLNGKLVLSNEYDQINAYGGEYLTTKKGDKIQIFDKFLNSLFSIEDAGNLFIEHIKDDIVMVTYLDDDFDWETRRYGFLNMKGDVLAGCLFDAKGIDKMYLNSSLSDLLISDSCAMLCVGNRCGYINKFGEVVVPLVYSVIVPFPDGTIYGKKQDGSWQELDLKTIQKNQKQE